MVDSRHPLYNKYIKSWQKCVDAFEGQEAIKEKRDLYLPKLSGHIVAYDSAITADDRSRGILQTDDEYNNYLKRAIFYNFTKKIVNGLNEQLFRKDVIVEVPDAMQSIVDKFTYDGKTLQTAIKESNRRIFLAYRDVLIIDYPKVAEGEILSLKDEETLNLRPYVIYYPAQQVINWRFENINNTSTLSQVIIEEYVEEQDKDDEFEIESILQYRVLDLERTDVGTKYRIRLYRKADSGKFELFEEPIYPMISGKNIDYIPCYFLTQKGISDDLDYPIMNDVVDINIAHYINSADYENALNITGSPTPVIIGYDSDPDYEEPIALGPSRALMLNGQNANAFFMEYQGKGADAIADAMDNKIKALSAIAGKMINSDPKGVESSETAEIHRMGDIGTLSSFAISISQAYEIILNQIAAWLNINGEINIKLNTDYVSTQIDPALLSNLNTAYEKNMISKEVYYYNMQKGEMIPDDWTFEQESDAISRQRDEAIKMSIGFEQNNEENTIGDENAI